VGVGGGDMCACACMGGWGCACACVCGWDIKRIKSYSIWTKKIVKLNIIVNVKLTHIQKKDKMQQQEYVCVATVQVPLY